MLEEIELQGMDKCKVVDRDIDRETIDPPEMYERIAYEKEGCIEEICNMSLPKLHRINRYKWIAQRNKIRDTWNKYYRNKWIVQRNKVRNTLRAK